MGNRPSVKITVRMWSRTRSLKPIAARLGSTGFVRDKGDGIPPVRPGVKRRIAPENYLSTEESTTDVRAVRDQVAQLARLVESEPLIAHQVSEGTLDVVVWVAIFGDQGSASFDDLDIDMTPFGSRIGLVLENYSDFDETGNPRKLLVGPSTRRRNG